MGLLVAEEQLDIEEAYDEEAMEEEREEESEGAWECDNVDP